MQILRLMGAFITTSQFYIHGRRNSTLNGYVRHVKDYIEPVQDAAIVSEGGDGCELTFAGKAVIITGANSGIGYELASYAAGKGARVYMVSLLT